jgi:hypothetical protein
MSAVPDVLVHAVFSGLLCSQPLIGIYRAHYEGQITRAAANREGRKWQYHPSLLGEWGAEGDHAHVYKYRVS